MPGSSSSGNMSPQSTAIRSSPDSTSIMLRPISPRPPRGIRRTRGSIELLSTQEFIVASGFGGPAILRRVEAVIFDLGGVVMGSPLGAIARYERDHGLAPQAVNRAIRTAGEAGAWSRLERGELSLQAFLAPFEADCRACGVEASAAGVMRYITGGGAPRPAMVEAIRRIRARGLRIGALTNNWVTEAPRPPHAVRE